MHHRAPSKSWLPSHLPEPLRGLALALALFAGLTTLNGCASPADVSSAGATPIREVPSSIPPAISAELSRIGAVVAPPATAPLYVPLQAREPYVGVSVTRNLAYGSDARHRLDLFAPAVAGAGRTVLVFVHGGAFVAGNKRTGDSPFYDNIMLWAARAGMVGVNMTYRLAPQHPWPAAQQDIADALRWVRTHVGQFGGRADRIVLMGHSAGAAHVAQYIGHPQFHVTPGSGLAGAIMISGIFDTATAQPNPPLQAYFGRDAELYSTRSALPGMKRARVPMLLAYAELNPPDFHRQSEQAHRALCSVDRCPTTLKLMGHSHMSEIYSINSPDAALTDRLAAFITRL